MIEKNAHEQAGDISVQVVNGVTPSDSHVALHYFHKETPTGRKENDNGIVYPFDRVNPFD